MTEPTDETVMALWCLLPSEVQDGRELDDIRPWVAAVLDAAGQELCLKPRGHVFHPLAKPICAVAGFDGITCQRTAGHGELHAWSNGQGLVKW